MKTNRRRTAHSSDNVHDLCFSPDGKDLVFSQTRDEGEETDRYAGLAGYLCICDARSGEIQHDIYLDRPFIKAIDCSEDYTIATGCGFNQIQIVQNTSLEERRRERKTMMLSLRRANRRRRDRQGNPLPSESGRKVYDVSGVLQKVHDFL